jgi:hypothetical protein
MSASSTAAVTKPTHQQLSDIFGEFNVDDVINWAQKVVRCDVRRPIAAALELLAFFGDAELQHCVTRKLISMAREDKLYSHSVHRLTLWRSLYVCNQSLAAFLRARFAEECAVYGATTLSNDHTWGTLFEAFLFVAACNGSPSVQSIVDSLVLWVDQNMDASKKSSMLRNCVDVDVLKATRRDELFPGRRVSVIRMAPLMYVPLASDSLLPRERWSLRSASEAGVRSHAFDAAEIQPRHVTIKGSFSLHTWQGCGCNDCGAMLVTRKVTNTRAEWFVIGREMCPRAPLSSWLDEYVDDYVARASHAVGDGIVRNEVEDWILVHGDRTDLECTTCGILYSYNKCSNKNPCRRAGAQCSKKSPCRADNRYCQTCAPFVTSGAFADVWG